MKVLDLTGKNALVTGATGELGRAICRGLAECGANVAVCYHSQKEVAERLEAQPGSKDYGPLTISVQTEMKVKLALQVGRNSFMPRPKVDSSVVVLTPLKEKPAIEDRKHFIWVVKMCFSQRRKTLNNNLKSLLPDKTKRDELIAELGVEPRIRPEDLTIEQFIKIAKFIPAK